MADHEKMLPKIRVHQKWHIRFVQQFYALFWKNVLLAYRNWKATTVRLAAPFIFLLLVSLIDQALQQNEKSFEDSKVVRNPPTEYITNIPPCRDDLFIGGDCLSFLYTVSVDDSVSFSAANKTVNDIVTSIRNTNQPVIELNDVLYMQSREDANRWFLDNPEKSLAAVHFVVGNGLKWIDYTLQTNSTPKYFKGEFQDANFFAQIPLQNAIQRAIATRHIQNQTNLTTTIDWTMGYKNYPHPAFETGSVAGALLGPFLFAANMFGVVIQMNAMVSEKESGLKQALRTMGMLDSAYWTSWAAWEIVLNLCTSLLNIAFGCIFQFRFFLDNNFFLVFFLLFLFQISMVGIGFLLSALINRVVLATMFGFIIFVLGWITYTVLEFGIPYTSQYFEPQMYISVIFTMLPWNVFMKGVIDLADATANAENGGLSFSRRFEYCKDEDNSISCETEKASSNDYINCECVLALGHLYWILIVLTIGYMLLAVYFEKVVPNEYGVWLHPLYFLDPRYWGYKLKRSSNRSLKKLEVKDNIEHEIDVDVQEEMDKMNARLDANGQPVSSGKPAELFTLQKRFGKQFFAMKGSSFSINEGELFCLLGPNGAGKTTTINCLTGVLRPNGGEAFVYDHSITEPGGMDAIRSIMGVCPQFDVLWKHLTGREHLWIFGLVKGLYFAEVEKEAANSLEKVALTTAARQRVGTYSGGMRRRLSVAIALLGDPKIVFLDEPTTGMDPISRRYVWDIIEAAKTGRAIVLTTHSMEEADILGDRISIMARGEVRAIGSNIRLKQKFGAGYSISISVKEDGSSNGGERGNATKQFVHKLLGIHPQEENRAYITYLIPTEKEKELPNFLLELEKRQDEFGITDIHLSLTTLEEVFLRIARTAEIEALRATGVTQMIVPFTDGSRVTIEIGQDQFTHPVTNVTYAVQWGQTDTGTLQITDAIPLGAVPDGVPDPNLSALN